MAEKSIQEQIQRLEQQISPRHWREAILNLDGDVSKNELNSIDVVKGINDQIIELRKQL